MILGKSRYLWFYVSVCTIRKLKLDDIYILLLWQGAFLILPTIFRLKCGCSFPLLWSAACALVLNDPTSVSKEPSITPLEVCPGLVTAF